MERKEPKCGGRLRERCGTPRKTRVNHICGISVISCWVVIEYRVLFSFYKDCRIRSLRKVGVHDPPPFPSLGRVTFWDYRNAQNRSERKSCMHMSQDMLTLQSSKVWLRHHPFTFLMLPLPSIRTATIFAFYRNALHDQVFLYNFTDQITVQINMHYEFHSFLVLACKACLTTASTVEQRQLYNIHNLIKEKMWNVI